MNKKRLNPLNDYMFLKVMGEKGDEEQLCSFLNAVLKREGQDAIKSVEIIENKMLAAEVVGDKTSILDLRSITAADDRINIEIQLRNLGNMNEPPRAASAQTCLCACGGVLNQTLRINCLSDGGKLMNVEMSVNPDNFEPIRLEFHTGKLFTGQDIRGIQKTYNALNDAYQIAFLVKGRFFEDAGFLHTFEYYGELRKMPLGGRTHIITVELAKLDYLLDKPVNEMSASER
jgi:hypothetical protein